MTSRAKEERSRDTPQLHRTASPLTKAEATAGSKPNEANARARRRTDQVGESCGEPGRGVGVCLFEQRNVKALRYLEAETLGPFLQQAAILAIVSSDRLGERGSTRRGGWAVVCVCVCVCGHRKVQLRVRGERVEGQERPHTSTLLANSNI